MDEADVMELSVAAAKPITFLTLRRPDDWHVHLRDGPMLAEVVADTAQHFGRAIVMPNLVPPVLTAADASAYRDRILKHCTDYPTFQPLMTLYLTETTDANALYMLSNSIRRVQQPTQPPGFVILIGCARF